jgi:hypothetical protein
VTADEAWEARQKERVISGGPDSDRREFLAGYQAASERDLPGVNEVKRMRLRPQDIIVLLVPEKMSMEDFAILREKARHYFRENTVVVLDGGKDIVTVGPEDV